ncbi:MAG: hypothetical protein SH817_10370 [Leptospira sp.]|nr:hypothetical protein [Leptospira sp.]
MKINHNGKDYTILAGMSSALDANGGGSFQKAITIENNTSVKGRIIGAVVRYSNTNLSDVAIDIRTQTTKQNPAIAGDLALTVVGSLKDSPGFNVFPFPGIGIHLPKNLAVEIWLKTWAVAVPDRGVMVALLMEESPDEDEIKPKEKEKK